MKATYLLMKCAIILPNNDHRYYPIYVGLLVQPSTANRYCWTPAEVYDEAKHLDSFSRRKLFESLKIEFSKHASEVADESLKLVYSNWSTAFREKLDREPIAFELDILNNKDQGYPFTLRTKAAEGENVMRKYKKLNALARRIQSSGIEDPGKIKAELCAFAQKITSLEYQNVAITFLDYGYANACNDRASEIWKMYPDCRPKK